METFADGVDIASGEPVKFDSVRILLQDRADWFGACLEVWETDGDHELPETVLYQHGLVINEWMTPNEVRYAGRRLSARRIPEGAVSLTPADVPYSASSWGRTRATVVGLRPEVIAAALRMRGAREVELKPSHGIADPFIQAAVQTLAADIRDGNPLGSLYGDTVISALAAHLVRTHAADPRIEITELKSGPVERERIREFIHDRLGESLTLREISQALELDIYSFARWFKKEFGIPPHRYVLEARVERAKQLLKRSPLAIASIADECGFSSQSHLTHVFKRHVGISPAAFRAASRALSGWSDKKAS